MKPSIFCSVKAFRGGIMTKEHIRGGIMTKEHKRQLINVGAVVLIAIMLIVLTINIITIIKLKARQEELLKNLDTLSHKQEQINIELNNASTDAYLKQYARENLGLTEEGEKVFVPEGE